MAAGDWQCPNIDCLNHTKMVFASKASCPKCGASRDGPDEGFVPEAGNYGPGQGAYLNAHPGGGSGAVDWQCPNTGCLNHQKMVFGKHDSCPKCGSPKNPARAGDWACPNKQCVNNKNAVFGSKSSCPKCGTPRPGSNGFAPASAGVVGIHGRPQFGSSAVRSTPYGMPLDLPPMRHPPGTRIVYVPVPVPMHQMPSRAGGGGHPGDWQCPNADCQNHRNKVFAKHESCPQCGAGKPSYPDQAPGHSGRLGDWQCPNEACQNNRNNVFGKHDACPKCGSPKPF